jgi:H+/Cl- antiporter ClcA
MIETEARPGPYLRLLSLTALVGLVAAGVTFLFVTLVHAVTKLIWVEAASALGLPAPVLTLVICTLGGLLVGLLVRFFGDHSGIFAEIMQEFGRTGRFDYRAAPGIVLTALVSLVSGASLGPEAPLADASGGIGTWIAERLRMDPRESRSISYSGVSGMLGAFITAPVGGALLALEAAQAGGSGLASYFWTLFPSLVASAVAAVVFAGLTGAFFAAIYLFPEYQPSLRDLLPAIPLGLLGGIVGVLFFVVLRRLQALMAPLKHRPILRGLVGGLGLGIAGSILPLVLFSGEEESLVLMEQAAAIGAPMLVLLAAVKLLLTGLGLATGWKGGYVFPILFVGIALGLALNLLFPQLPVAVAVSAMIAGTLAAALRAPLFAIMFTMALVQRETAPVVAVAVVAASLLAALAALWSARRTPAAAPSTG